VGELDGTWEVRRLSGALPPLAGVRKRIAGTRGETIVGGGPGIPFDVRGLELHYRGPFAPLVDKLERRDGEYFGRALVLGREYGQFRMRRLEMGQALEDQLVQHLDEAHALEQNVERMLDSMIQSSDDPEIIDRLEHHKLETQEHAATMRRRLEAHGAQPSMVRQAAGLFESLLKLPLDVVRGEKTARNARDAYMTEHLEIASYELLRRVAERAGDEETAQACLEILEQERAMAQFVDERWDRFTELALIEAGIAVR
jgi:ferritin-like metal-binding protein YciE